MNPVARSAAMVGVGFALLVLQSGVTAVAPLYPFTPSVTLPIVFFLGVSPDVHITRGAAVAFVLGYLHDIFCGNQMSLQTFVSVATFMLARGAGLRFVLRGAGFQVGATVIVAILTGGGSIALRAMFEQQHAPMSGGVWRGFLGLLPPALATGLISPPIFAIISRIEGANTKREAAA